VRLRRCYLVTTIALWITVAASPADAQKRYDPGANDTEIKIGQTNPYSGPASSFGTIGRMIVAYYHMVNDLATFPSKRMTTGHLTLARAAALAAGLPTTGYQPGWDYPGYPGSC
jgi:hypothetical protein